jgi:methionyl-tRNA synthetase
MNKPAKILVTAALPYANGPLHIGHIAGCFLPSDTYVRFLKLRGEDVKFICGSDEHGVAIDIKARNENKSPKEVVDYYHHLMADTFKEFGIEFDIYSRTSSKIHHETASDFFLKLYNDKVFIEKETEQYYDEEAKQFLADRYITGTCPHCGYEQAYGDQCEKCGTSLSPSELKNPVSALSGNKPVLRKTKNWFLPLDKLQPQMEAYVNKHKSDWRSHVFGQCTSWLKQGLQPRAMTRDLDWGVKVPLKEAENKVLYVWFDAPIGYISATKELLPDTWEEYWKGKDSKLIHFIGKDNIVFHCLIFPAMLMTHGEYVLPSQVPANEFLNLEGQKISTSRNWAVWLHEYLKDFPDKKDELKYVLTSIAPETSDSEFTWKDFQARVNNELVAILGNFINRITVLCGKYYEGKIPPIESTSIYFEDVQKQIDIVHQEVTLHLENFRFRQGLFSVMELARFGNKFLTIQEPWKMIKDKPKEVEKVMMDCLQISANLALMLQPFLPDTSAKIFKMLGLKTRFKWNESPEFKPEHQLGESILLFKKIEDEEIEFQLNKLKQASEKNTLKEANKDKPLTKENITFDEFSKLDLRTGTIIEAEKVPKTDKLLKLVVDIGSEKRTIVSGIAKDHHPENIIGQQVIMVTNLAPRNIKGIESKGMILMVESEGKLNFAQVSAKSKNGSVVS